MVYYNTLSSAPFTQKLQSVKCGKMALNLAVLVMLIVSLVQVTDAISATTFSDTDANCAGNSTSFTYLGPDSSGCVSAVDPLMIESVWHAVTTLPQVQTGLSSITEKPSTEADV